MKILKVNKFTEVSLIIWCSAHSRSGTGIFLNEEVAELIGFAQGVNNLNINSGDFLFVD